MATAPQTRPAQSRPTTALAIVPGPLAQLAERFNIDKGQVATTLRQTVMKDGSDAEMVAFAIVANEYGLNPFTKEIYAFPKRGGGIVPMVPIDGWAKIVNRNPDFDGCEFVENWDESGELVSITCTMHLKSRSHPVSVTEYYAECVRQTEPWKMKVRMLRHKSFMQAARIAFSLAGIFDEDEARDIVRSVESTVVQQPQRRSALPAPEQQEEAPPVDETEVPFDHQPGDSTYQEPQQQSGARKISEAQAKRFFAKCKASGKGDDQIKEYLREVWGIQHSRDIGVDIYDQACEWADAQ